MPLGAALDRDFKLRVNTLEANSHLKKHTHGVIDSKIFKKLLTKNSY